ncbi:DUF1244 domain-containing protein [Tropicimonas sp.]|uniref:DUF1244 domain-containing protein n=1 Tax=Tropicimonas sp. TaxID=2067044 RepID=UPI003A8AC736
MDDNTRTEVEAATFRRLRRHLMEDRADVPNIDMMNATGFCRNCLSRWYGEAARERGVEMTEPEAREAFYGVPYLTWKAANQTAAAPDTLAAFEREYARNTGPRDKT